eukprot:11212289-Lingulodinium_polyedra.AAC.1
MASSSRLAFEPLGFEAPGGDEDEQADRAMEAQTKLAEALIYLKVTGKLSAKDVCTLMWWAERAGLPAGPATAFAYTPDSNQTGHYNRHFNAVMGTGGQLEGGYTMKIPGKVPQQEDSTTLVVPCLPVHEALEQEVAATPDM